MKIKNTPTKKVKPKRNSNLLVTIFVAILTLGLGLGIFFALNNALATESYYVLTQDVPAKTQVTGDMLEKIETAKGTAPQNAVGLSQVEQGTIYTRYPLKAGDILSESNTGLDLETTSGIPDDWVITSFNISVDNAAGGNIQKGDYFDIIGVDPENGAQYLFYNVLALAVNRQDNNVAVTEEGKAVPLGEQLQYVVGMPSDKAPLLQHAISRYENIQLTLAPNSLAYKERSTKELTKNYIMDPEHAGTDLFDGTDNSFTPVLRDNNGRPVTAENCKNGVITPDTLCQKINTKEDDKRENSNSKIENTKSAVKENTQSVKENTNKPTENINTEETTNSTQREEKNQ